MSEEQRPRRYWLFRKGRWPRRVALCGLCSGLLLTCRQLRRMGAHQQLLEEDTGSATGVIRVAKSISAAVRTR